jgi:hypothetical protein
MLLFDEYFVEANANTMKKKKPNYYPNTIYSSILMHGVITYNCIYIP